MILSAYKTQSLQGVSANSKFSMSKNIPEFLYITDITSVVHEGSDGLIGTDKRQ